MRANDLARFSWRTTMICVPVFSIFGVVAILSLPSEDELAFVSRETLNREASRQTTDSGAPITRDDAAARPAAAEFAAQESSARGAFVASKAGPSAEGDSIGVSPPANFASHIPSRTRPTTGAGTRGTPSAVQVGTLALHNASAHDSSPDFEHAHGSGTGQPELLMRLAALERRLQKQQDTEVDRDIARLELQLRMMEQHLGQLMQLATTTAACTAVLNRHSPQTQSGSRFLEERINELQQRIDQLASGQQRASEAEREQRPLVELERHLLDLRTASRGDDGMSRQSEVRTEEPDAGPPVPFPEDDPFEFGPAVNDADDRGDRQSQ